jgi:hypothetical protein
MPIANKVIFVKNMSMVGSWEREIWGWMGEVHHLQPLVAIGAREKIQKTVKDFVGEGFRCLLISYEWFRTNSIALSEAKRFWLFWMRVTK